MKKKLVAVGVLAGAVTLTGVAGSAYAQSGGTTAKPTTAKPGKGEGPILVSCVGGQVKGKDKGEKGIVTSKEPGKLPPGAPAHTLKIKAPHGAKFVKVTKVKGKPPVVTVGKPPKGLPPKPPKGVHCTTMKPGTPGTLPAPPTR